MVAKVSFIGKLSAGFGEPFGYKGEPARGSCREMPARGPEQPLREYGSSDSLRLRQLHLTRIISCKIVGVLVRLYRTGLSTRDLNLDSGILLVPPGPGRQWTFHPLLMPASAAFFVVAEDSNTSRCKYVTGHLGRGSESYSESNLNHWQSPNLSQ